jgi:hypothetical protein
VINFGRFAQLCGHWASYINQKVSLAQRRAIHVRRVAALRDLISVA